MAEELTPMTTPRSVPPSLSSGAAGVGIVRGSMGTDGSMNGPTVPLRMVKKVLSTSPSMRGSSVKGIVAPSRVSHSHVVVGLCASC